MRVACGIALAAGVAAVLAPGLAGQPVTGISELVVSGRGFGHGMGLSQWGAERRARAGQGYRQILAFYYPGTELRTVADRSVRVLVGEARTVRVGSTAPFTLRDARGRTLRLPAGMYPSRPRSGSTAGRSRRRCSSSRARRRSARAPRGITAA